LSTKRKEDVEDEGMDIVVRPLSVEKEMVFFF